MVFGCLMTIVSGIILARFRQAMKREDDRREEINTIQADITLLKLGLLTEDKLRTLVKEEIRAAFKDFELGLINDGRLVPRRVRNG
jgi:hypothetical protein